LMPVLSSFRKTVIQDLEFNQILTLII